MKCYARISGASGDWEGGIPKEVLSWSKKWSKEQSQDVGKTLLDSMGKRLRARFLPISIPDLSIHLESTEDIDSSEILPFEFDFEDDGSPIIGAYAVFEIPFKPEFKRGSVEKWRSKDGDSLAWCVAFYWEIEGREIYLDIDFDSVTFSAEI